MARPALKPGSTPASVVGPAFDVDHFHGKAPDAGLDAESRDIH
jgi:hypothetical protein